MRTINVCIGVSLLALLGLTAIGMGTGGDNSNDAIGNPFEGLMTTHYASAAADDAVKANIVSVYGQAVK